MTPILTWLIEEAAGPQAQVENRAGQFAINATGFRTNVRRVRDEREVVVERWYDQAHKGEARRPRRFIHDWVKLHSMCCVVKAIFTAGLAPRFWSDAAGSVS